MSKNQLNTRIQHKCDTPDNWAKATNFKPLKGELIIYAATETTPCMIKIGDGEHYINDLDFEGAHPITYGTEAITPGSASDEPEGTVHFVYKD